jgi:hypothetical protein
MVSERCSLDWDTSCTGLVVGWRWSPWYPACSSSSTAPTSITGGLSMSRPSAVLLCFGCSDGPANIFWPANESASSQKFRRRAAYGYEPTREAAMAGLVELRSSSHQSCPDCISGTRRCDSREGQMGLMGGLVPEHKTFADFCKDNGEAICKKCARFIMLCWALDLSLHAARPRATRCRRRPSRPRTPPRG